MGSHMRAVRTGARLPMGVAAMSRDCRWARPRWCAAAGGGGARLHDLGAKKENRGEEKREEYGNQIEGGWTAGAGEGGGGTRVSVKDG